MPRAAPQDVPVVVGASEDLIEHALRGVHRPAVSLVGLSQRPAPLAQAGLLTDVDLLS